MRNVFKSDTLLTVLLAYILLFISLPGSSQINLFTETFDEPNASTIGASAEGIAWSSVCAGCMAGDYFAVQNGTFENNDSNGAAVWTTAGIDISSCVRIEVSFDYTGEPYGTNLEANGDCNMGGPCSGNPVDASGAGCFNCWDFMDFKIQIDGTFTDIGIIGTTNTSTATTMTFEAEDCAGLGDEAILQVTSSTWAGAEFMRFDNATLVCYDTGGLTGILTGGGDICENTCTTVEWEISGGVAPYDLEFNFNFGVFDLDFIVPSPAAMGSINVCLDNSSPIPFFDVASNTLYLNEVFGTSATIELLSVSDNTMCNITLSNQIVAINIVPAPTISTILPIELCTDETGTATVDLSAYEADIDGNGNTVIWYSDPSLTMEIGTMFSTMTNAIIYAVVESAAGCQSDDIEVQILLTQTPNIDPVMDVEDCEEYILPPISGVNLTVDVGYFSGPDGTGSSYNVGQAVTTTTTIYIYNINGDCSDEQSFLVTILPSPEIDPLTSPVLECGFYVLPEITGTNVNPISFFYDLPGGIGTQYEAGDTIFTNSIIYAYANVGTCFDEIPLLIQISQAPDIMMPDLIEDCGYVILPVIEGSNLSNPAYFTGADGTGTQLNPGDTIFANIDLFIYDALGNCIGEDGITIDVSAGPILNPVADEEACDYFVLETINGTDLIAPSYYDGPFASGNNYQEGDTIFNSITIYIVDTVPNSTCGTETSFDIDIITNISAGDDIAVNSCIGSVIDLFNLLDNTIPTDGIFVDTESTGGLINDSLDVNAGGQMTYDLLYIVENLCGPDSAKVHVDVVQQTDAGLDQDNPICEGALINPADYIDGDPGGQFYIAGETDPIDMDIVTTGMLGEIINLIYIVGDGTNCPQDSAQYDFEVISAPSFDAQPIVQSCTFFLLPIINGTGLDGDEVYYTEPMGQGAIYNASDTIFDSQTVYLFYDDPNCQTQDSMQILVKLTTRSSVNETLCPGGSIVVNGEVYDESQMTGTEVATNSVGCDSTISVELVFYTIDTNKIVENLCFGESIVVNNEVYDETNMSGVEILFGQAANSCDSVITIDLSFSSDAITPINEMICSGDSILINGIYYSEQNPTGMDTIFMQGGCDSILDVTVGFLQTSSGMMDTMICEEASFMYNGTLYDKDNLSGIELLSGSNQNGCDSVVSVTVILIDVENGNIGGEFCAGDTVEILGVLFHVDNPEADIVLEGASAQNCDSTVLVSLDFSETLEGMRTETICEGSTITIEGTIYSEQSPTGAYTVETSEGCDSIVNVLVEFSEIIPDLEIVSPTCQGDGFGYVVFNGLFLPSDEYYYSLDGNDLVSLIEIGDTLKNISVGEHTLVLGDMEGCFDFVDFSIENVDIPTVVLPESVVIQEGDDFNVNLAIDPDNTILWTPDTDISCTDCSDPSFSPSMNQIYYLTVTTPEGCFAMDSILIRVEQEYDIYIPNLFTPNEDGINDVFFISSEDNATYDLFIYDRWGSKVFEGLDLESNNIADGWNGRFHEKSLNPNVYVYYARFYPEVIDGEEQTIIELTGDLTIIK